MKIFLIPLYLIAFSASVKTLNPIDQSSTKIKITNNNLNNKCGLISDPNLDAKQANIIRRISMGIFGRTKQIVSNNLHPWYAKITTFRNNEDDVDEKPFCGGVFISSQHILTVANCFVKKAEHLKKPIQEQLKDNELKLDIEYFDHAKKSFLKLDSQSISSTKLISRELYVSVHPNFKNCGLTNCQDNIALITLETPLNDEQIIPICIPDKHADMLEPEQVSIVGYGGDEDKNSRNLTVGMIRRISTKKCQSRYPKNQLPKYTNLKYKSFDQVATCYSGSDGICIQ